MVCGAAEAQQGREALISSLDLKANLHSFTDWTKCQAGRNHSRGLFDLLEQSYNSTFVVILRGQKMCFFPYKTFNSQL